MNGPAMNALTDQAIAALRDMRADATRPDGNPQVRLQLPVSADIARIIGDQFGDDAQLAGRVMVAAAQTLATVVAEFRTGGHMNDRSVSAIVVNILGFAGEQLTRQAGDPA